MRLTLLTLVTSLVVVAAAGCAHDPLPPKPYYGPTQTMAQVVQEINANNARIKTLRASHTFEATLVDDKGKSRTFSGDGYLLFAKPDNLLLTAGSSIIKFFEVGSNDKQYWFTAFPDEVSTQWYGDKAAMTDAAARQIPIRPDLILEVLGVSTIETDFLAPPVPTMRFNNDADAYMFVWNRPLTNRWVAEKEVWYDRKTRMPRLILLFDANGRIILRAYLSDPMPVAGTGGMIASRYDLFFPENKSHMSFHLTDRPEIPASIKKGKITIPNPGSFAFPEEPGVKKQIEIK